jgi:hypothetical protein
MEEGQMLLQTAAGTRLPETLLGKKYEPHDRAIVDDLLSRLYAELASCSPFAQEIEPGESVRLFFGPRDQWRRKTDKDTPWVMGNPAATVPVSLTKLALDGAGWAGFMILAPGFGRAVPADASRVVWPVLRKLKKEQSVRAALGLNKFEEKLHSWPDDPDLPTRVCREDSC